MDIEKYKTSPSKQSYLRCSSKHVPCPQALGYTMGRAIGSGSFAKVKAAWSPFEVKMIAIKIINKAKLSPEGLTKFLPRELEILQKLSHPNIISLFQIIETDHHCFVAMELAENGDLLDYLCANGQLPEAESRFIFHQMCQAVAYCHSLNIAHRDMKPENVFFNKAMDVKIGDFGFALETKTNLCSTPCGPYWYGAPEISSLKKYNPFIADSWSMGMIVHVMVCGGLPFEGENQGVVKRIWGATSKEFKVMVEGLLTVDASSRSSVTDILTHEWITTSPSTRPSWYSNSECKFSNENCLPSYLHNIGATESCHSNSKWKKVIKSSYPHYRTQQSSMESSLLAHKGSGSVSLHCSLESFQTSTNVPANSTSSSLELKTSKGHTKSKSHRTIGTRVRAVGKRLRRFFRKLRQPSNVS